MVDNYYHVVAYVNDSSVDGVEFDVSVGREVTKLELVGVSVVFVGSNVTVYTPSERKIP